MGGATSAPKPDARRQRHAIAEATSSNRVPVTGRVGRPPTPPFPLGEAGRRWWRWAWATPQATKWHKGFTETLALRASLEDRYTTMVEAGDATEAARLLGFMLRLDTEFGLTPMAAAKQHIVFVEDDSPHRSAKDTADNVTPMRNRMKGMRS